VCTSKVHVHLNRALGSLAVRDARTTGMDGAHKAVAQVRKRQRTHKQNAFGAIDSLVGELSTAAEQLAEAPVVETLQALQQRVTERKLQQQLASDQKQYHAAVSKLGKTISKELESEPTRSSQGCLAGPAEQRALQQALAEYLLREGHSDVWQLLCQEAGLIPAQEQATEAILQIQQAVDGIRQHCIEPALQWVSASCDSGPQRSALLFKLHRLKFVQLLQSNQMMQAVQYCRAQMSPNAEQQLTELRALMGCLSSSEPMANERHKEVLSRGNWEEVADTFMGEACAAKGLPSSSHLAVAIEAGLVGLPQMLKVATVLKSKGIDWQPSQPPPIQVDLKLSQQLCFHSVFVCPVSRELSCATNPPVLLPCNHVICRTSMMNLVRHNSSRFKCPYCPTDVHTMQARDIYFS